MEKLVPELLASQAIALVTPLYYFGFSSQLKRVIDLLYAYNHKLAGNKKVFLLAAAHGQDKTFAGKYRTTVSKIKKKYVRDGIFGVDYMTKEGAKRCELYHDGFVRNKETLPDYTDVLPQYRRYRKQNGLAMRLKRKVCELCGEPAEDILMHHVRRLKDLGIERSSELLMKRIRRKSLALCPACFMQVKAGQL